MTYTIGLKHHSIGQSRSITVEGTLTTAKRLATREFGAGYLDHEIVIMDGSDMIVARRRIADRRWTEVA